MRPNFRETERFLILSYDDDRTETRYEPKSFRKELRGLEFDKPTKIYLLGGDDDFSLSNRFFRHIGIEDQREDPRSFTVFGGDGDDILRGTYGSTLRGGEGDDVLTTWGFFGRTTYEGGAGSDRFHAGGNAKVRVLDFESDADSFLFGPKGRIELADEEEVAELVSRFVQRGDNAVFREDLEGDGKFMRIVLVDTDVDELTADHFTFYLPEG